MKLAAPSYAAVLAYLAAKGNNVPGWLSLVAIGVIALAGYLGESQTERDRVSKEAAEAAKQAAEARIKSAEEIAFEILKEYKGQIAGPLAFLACAIVDKKPVETVRMGILMHVVDVARKHLGLPSSDRRLTATWAVARDDYQQWEIVAYDRYHAERQPGTLRPIAADAPGAPRAFLTGEHDFIADTQSAEVQEHFRAGGAYRSILSVPARILNVRGIPTRDIDGRRSAILGVLNVDCTDPGVLRDDLRFVVTDAAFLLAIVELIGAHRAST